MAGNITSQGVTKLKELLFDSEAERLADLARRLDALGNAHEELRNAIADRKAYEEGARAELARRLDAVYDRAGSADRFSLAVSDVLDDAIIRTERERHSELQTALAPVVVKTVKTEIVNSQDALVEALYPMTGQMVKAYVASAMKDLVNQVNRRLESNAFMLRLKSLTTGRSMAELALAESQRLEVEELLLIRRSTGELMARWPEKPGSNNHDHVLGGVLTAINSFATEALEEDENTLRQIDLGASQVYLRTSPTYLLAAKCSGTAGRSIEQVIDDEFLATVSGIRGDDEANTLAAEGIATLGPRITARIAEQYDIIDRPALGVSPVKIMAVLIGLPLLAWVAWSTYVSYETNRVRETARQIIETSPEIQGYPTTLTVAPRGRSLTISGLAPSDPALQTVIDRLSGALPDTAIDSQMAVVPQGAQDRSPEIAALRKQLAELNRDLPRRTALRTLLQADQGLSDAGHHLARLAALGEASDSEAARAQGRSAIAMTKPLDAARAGVADALTALNAGAPASDAAQALATTLNQRADALESALSGLSRQASLIGLQTAPSTGQDAIPSGTTEPAYDLAAERLSAIAQRLQLVAVALIQAEQTRAAIPKPAPPPVIPGPTSLDRLAGYIKTNAIFFSDAIDYRSADAAESTLDALAKLMLDTDVLVRVVGYTDERGTASRNSSLSQLRADKVRDALITRGVPASRLVAVGRTSINDISTAVGPQSPNRRVEFEIGFKGETTP